MPGSTGEHIDPGGLFRWMANRRGETPAIRLEARRVPVSGSLTLDRIAAASLGSADSLFGTAMPTTAHLLDIHRASTTFSALRGCRTRPS